MSKTSEKIEIEIKMTKSNLIKASIDLSSSFSTKDRNRVIKMAIQLQTLKHIKEISLDE